MTSNPDNKTKSRLPRVVVAGDIVLDRHIYVGERLTLGERARLGTRLVEEAGGAAITQRLIAAVLDADLDERLFTWKQKVEQWKKGKQQKPKRNQTPPPLKPEKPACRLGCKLPGKSGLGWPEHLIGYASWVPQSRVNSKNQVWRLSKPFGYGPLNIDSGSGNLPRDTLPFLQPLDNLAHSSNVLVLDDAGDHFRHQENEALWHLPNDSKKTHLPKWIVLKLGGAVGQGDLWRRLMRCRPHERLIIIASSRLLRRSDSRLSRGLSWERTLEHLLMELRRNPAIRPLCDARHLILHFECDGASWLDFSRSEQPKAHLVFDCEHAEGEWSRRITGEAFGYQTCLTAAVVQTLVSAGQKNDPDFQSAMERGLSAMRNLREEGHGTAVSEKDVIHLGLGFPAARLAEEILHPRHRFARAVVPSIVVKEFLLGQRETSKRVAPWSILASFQNPVVPERPLYGFARQLTIRGEAALAHVPYLRIGKLLTPGRDEMEELRSLRRIMEAYRDTGSGKMPLCIGVFGAPGSGKSFGVEQLALGIFDDNEKDSHGGWMEFNLSQFASLKDLIGAFHQVRDRVLQGLLPVVFWDEFDSNEYYWLRYLLAPMQDGRFQEELITHTLGKCVFIFAGGTSETFEEFGPKESNREQLRHFILAKGPDFKSRLDGYLNVLGPNQRRLNSSSRRTRPTDPSDIFFPVRRALIIRTTLGLERAEVLDIDPGLLTALLEVSEYKQGARSLRKILGPLKAVGKNPSGRLQRWRIPAPNQLSLHVNTEEFHNMCARDYLFKTDENIQMLAPAIHEVWRAVGRREGLKPRYDMPYDQLPPDIKRSNEAAAQRIPDIIALVGLQVVAGAATKREESEVRKHIEHHLEALAEEEHNGWMAHLHSEGWKFAETRDDDKRRHNCLRPFNELRELDKDKDRDSVCHYPDFVRKAGFKIVFI